MTANAPTPTAKTPTTPDAPVVPAAVVPAAVVPSAAVTPPVVPPVAAVEPPAVPPVVAITPPTPPAVTPPVAAVVPPVVAVPERYDFVLDGNQKVSQGAIDAITPALREAGVTQEKATKLVTDFLKYQAGLPAVKNAADLEALRQDPELGLLNLGRTQNEVNEALASFTTPAERQKLSEMGMANDPVLVRMFRRIGRASMGVTNTPPSDPRPVEVKTTAQKLYGNPAKATHGT